MFQHVSRAEAGSGAERPSWFPSAAAAAVYVVFTFALCWGTSGICDSWLQALCGC